MTNTSHPKTSILDYAKFLSYAASQADMVGSIRLADRYDRTSCGISIAIHGLRSAGYDSVSAPEEEAAVSAVNSVGREQGEVSDQLTPTAPRANVSRSMGDSFSQQYTFPAERLPALNAAVEKLNKSLPRMQSKYGGQLRPVTLDVLSTELRPVPEGDGDMVSGGWGGMSDSGMIAYVTVRLAGDRPNLNGWEFIARILHGADDKGNRMNTFLSVPGVAIPKEYRDAPPNCSHCNTNRSRNDTFLVGHPEKGARQIGSSCLQEFFGGTDVHGIASYLSQVSSLAETAKASENDSHDSGGGSRGERRFNPEKVAAIAAFMAHKFGYLSVSKAWETGGMSTSQMIRELLENPGVGKRSDIGTPLYDAREALGAMTDEEGETYAELGRAAVEYAKSLKDKENPSDFDWNMSAAAHSAYSGGGVHPKTMGLFSYIPAAHKRELDREAAKKRAEDELAEASAGLGANVEEVIYTPGEFFITPAILLNLRPVYGQYGTTMVHKFRDASGRTLVWWASGGGDIADVNEKLILRAKVKNFGSYKGVEEINITNASVLTEEEAAVESAKMAKKKAKALLKK